ncbi:MAG TPA: hypothetical protein VJN21_07650 [Candidatus Acidoferrales bacterium]|nr:hypothetical protein [Candidatus Acidoferrales bacterium]
MPPPKVVSTERYFDACRFVCKHSIAFLEERNGLIHLRGSGTLVTIDGEKFILTANHVWRELRQETKIYISMIDRVIHKTEMYVAALEECSLSEVPKPDSLSADLTLLKINPIDHGHLDARLSFYGFSHEERGQADLSNDYVIIGAPGHVATYDPIDPTVLNFEMRATPVGKIEEENRPDLGLDFVTVYPHTDQDSPLYEYNGLSGGGLWELSYVPDETAVEGFRYETMFLGVNFLQERDDVTKPWTRVRCLGRRAVQSLINKYRQEKKK